MSNISTNNFWTLRFSKMFKIKKTYTLSWYHSVLCVLFYALSCFQTNHPQSGFLWLLVTEGSEQFFLCQELYLVNWSLWWGPHKYFIYQFRICWTRLQSHLNSNLSPHTQFHFHRRERNTLVTPYWTFFWYSVNTTYLISPAHHYHDQYLTITIKAVWYYIVTNSWSSAVQCPAVQWELDGAGGQPPCLSGISRFISSRTATQYTFLCTVVQRCSAHFTGLPCAAHLSSDTNYTCYVAKISEIINLFLSCIVIVTRHWGQFWNNTSNSTVIPYETTEETIVRLKCFFFNCFLQKGL